MDATFVRGLIVSVTIDVQADMVYWATRRAHDYVLEAADIHGSVCFFFLSQICCSQFPGDGRI